MSIRVLGTVQGESTNTGITFAKPAYMGAMDVMIGLVFAEGVNATITASESGATFQKITLGTGRLCIAIVQGRGLTIIQADNRPVGYALVLRNMSTYAFENAYEAIASGSITGTDYGAAVSSVIGGGGVLLLSASAGTWSVGNRGAVVLDQRPAGQTLQFIGLLDDTEGAGEYPIYGKLSASALVGYFVLALRRLVRRPVPLMLRLTRGDSEVLVFRLYRMGATSIPTDVRLRARVGHGGALVLNLLYSFNQGNLYTFHVPREALVSLAAGVGLVWDVTGTADGAKRLYARGVAVVVGDLIND